jgi:hypothetical protein
MRVQVCVHLALKVGGGPAPARRAVVAAAGYVLPGFPPDLIRLAPDGS